MPSLRERRTKPGGAVFQQRVPCKGFLGGAFFWKKNLINRAESAKRGA
jgi:hypothetical protein